MKLPLPLLVKATTNCKQRVRPMVFLVLVCCSSLPAAAWNEVASDTHTGYFVSNQFEPAAPISFVVLQDQAAFDKVFGIAMVMRDKSHRLPPDAFVSRMVVAAIHRGKAVVSYRVERVAAEGKTLVVRYTTKSEPSDTTEFACPLIISLLKGEYDCVQFVEDGKEIKKVATTPCLSCPVP